MAREAAAHCGWTARDRLSTAEFLETAANLRLRGFSQLLRLEKPVSQLYKMEASEVCSTKLRRQGSGGVIAIDHKGNIAVPFNTGGMFRATRTPDGTLSVDIW